MSKLDENPNCAATWEALEAFRAEYGQLPEEEKYSAIVAFVRNAQARHGMRLQQREAKRAIMNDDRLQDLAKIDQMRALFAIGIDYEEIIEKLRIDMRGTSEESIAIRIQLALIMPGQDAIKVLVPLANKGSAAAHYHIGVLRMKWEQLPKAISRFTKAAEQGFPGAQQKLDEIEAKKEQDRTKSAA